MSLLTAFLIVRDEEHLLPGCLRHLEGLADELVILDTGSTDGTARVIEHARTSGRFTHVHTHGIEFTDFGSAWQASLDEVRTDWALCIAADETVSDELRARINAMRRSGELDTRDGWYLSHANRVLGHVMRGCKLHGGKVLRLFRTARGRFNRALVHEGIELDDGCTTGTIDGAFYHDTMTTWRGYLRKVDQYTTLDVVASNRRFNPLHLLLTGPITFFKQYVLRYGIIDGWPGFVWSLTSAWSVTLRDFKRLRKALGHDYRARKDS